MHNTDSSEEKGENHRFCYRSEMLHIPFHCLCFRQTTNWSSVNFCRKQLVMTAGSITTDKMARYELFRCFVLERTPFAVAQSCFSREPALTKYWQLWQKTPTNSQHSSSLVYIIIFQSLTPLKKKGHSLGYVTAFVGHLCWRQHLLSFMRFFTNLGWKSRGGASPFSHPNDFHSQRLNQFQMNLKECLTASLISLYMAVHFNRSFKLLQWI